jgi:hypothetical protein
MKKQYMKPDMKVVKMCLMRMITTSPLDVDPTKTGNQEEAE